MRGRTLEGSRVAVEALQPVVDDGNAMGVAAHLLEAVEAGFGGEVFQRWQALARRSIGSVPTSDGRVGPG